MSEESNLGPNFLLEGRRCLPLVTVSPGSQFSARLRCLVAQAEAGAGPWPDTNPPASGGEELGPVWSSSWLHSLLPGRHTLWSGLTGGPTATTEPTRYLQVGESALRRTAGGKKSVWTWWKISHPPKAT